MSLTLRKKKRKLQRDPYWSWNLDNTSINPWQKRCINITRWFISRPDHQLPAEAPRGFRRLRRHTVLWLISMASFEGTAYMKRFWALSGLQVLKTLLNPLPFQIKKDILYNSLFTINQCRLKSCTVKMTLNSRRNQQFEVRGGGAEPLWI